MHLPPSLLLPLVCLLAVSSRSHAFQIGPLLSTCIDACQRGCDEIRRHDNHDNENVQLKFEDDPRSVVTLADMASQRAIVNSLRSTWGNTLHIVGEEDLDDDDSDNNVSEGDTSPLEKNILQDDIGETEELDPNDLTIFVDPLDGTREFVEGRWENCQVLVGIAIGGQAVAGAVGLPFPQGRYNATVPATIVYGLNGLGTGVRGTPLTRGPWPLAQHVDGLDYPHPHFATGDNPVPVIEEATKSLIQTFGGSTVTYGGAGNKILAAALGEVATSIQHKVGGPWDLCAPQALAQAMGAEMTDLFGQPIDMYRPDAPLRNNERGFLVSPPGSDHGSIVKAVQKSSIVQAYRESLTKEAVQS